MKRADAERVRYLGFTLVVGARSVEVLDPRGRRLGRAYTVSGARRIVRGYRSARWSAR